MGLEVNEDYIVNSNKQYSKPGSERRGVSNHLSLIANGLSYTMKDNIMLLASWNCSCGRNKKVNRTF